MDIVIHSDCPVTIEHHQMMKSAGHADLNLLKCLGYPDNQPPLAHWLRQLHQLEGRWLIVTPVYWQATHNDALFLACGEGLMDSPLQARAQYDAFSSLMASSGMKTHFHDAGMWLLQCDDQPPIVAAPPYTLLHQSLLPHLKHLDPTSFWLRLMTEVQMFMSASLTSSFHANGVWIWGEGELTAPVDRPIWVQRQWQYDRVRHLSTQVNMMPDEEHGMTAAFKKEGLKKNAVLLWDSVSAEQWDVLRRQFEQYGVHWYWNNVAYTIGQSSWFSRLFSV